MEVRHSFLVESALLTHGLPSVSNEDMLREWPADFACIVWIDAGEIVIGGMAEFTEFRKRATELIRINCYTVDEAVSCGLSGALTASGTMQVAARLGIPLVVSCGIGGIGDIAGEELCPDLPALENIPVALLCTSFKDMLDIPETLSWLQNHGVSVRGVKRPYCNGYQFILDDCAIDGVLPDIWKPAGKSLIFNPIPEERRLTRFDWLVQGIAAGKRAEAEGHYYHPAVNEELDRLSQGKAAKIQFASLIANALLAQELTSS